MARPKIEDITLLAPTDTHRALAAWIDEKYDVDLDITPDVVALVQRAYPLYRKSPEVAQAAEAARIARDAEAAKKAAVKAARDAEKRQRLLDELAKLDGKSGEPVKLPEFAPATETPDALQNLKDSLPTTSAETDPSKPSPYVEAMASALSGADDEDDGSTDDEGRPLISAKSAVAAEPAETDDDSDSTSATASLWDDDDDDF